MSECCIAVTEKIKQKDLNYKEDTILSYTIKYPEFSQLSKQKDRQKDYTKESSGSQGQNQEEAECFFNPGIQEFINRLNMFYRIKTTMYEKNNIRTLYRMAMDDYENSVAHGYPVHKYEAYTNYEVTYNKDCILSLYSDQYEYTGGANVITTRVADNWDLKRQRRIELNELFPYMVNYKEYIINSIIKQIEEDIANGNNMYFEDYPKLVNEYFNGNNFYLNDKGVVLYYNLYDIAPYAAGMPTFTIPYSAGRATLPE